MGKCMPQPVKGIMHISELTPLVSECAYKNYVDT